MPIVLACEREPPPLPLLLRVAKLAEDHLHQALRGRAPPLVKVREILIDDRSPVHPPDYTNRRRAKAGVWRPTR